VLHNPADRANVLILKELEEAAPALHLTLQPHEVRGPGEFEGAVLSDDALYSLEALFNNIDITGRRSRAKSAAAPVRVYESSRPALQPLDGTESAERRAPLCVANRAA
jgi:hypothetical protein